MHDPTCRCSGVPEDSAEHFVSVAASPLKGTAEHGTLSARTDPPEHLAPPAGRGSAARSTSNPEPSALLDALLDLVAERLASRLSPAPVDELVPLTAEALAKMGLEARAVHRLVVNGALKTVAIGRRRFTRRSYLLALVDTLPAVEHRNTKPAKVTAPQSDLEIAVAKSAARRARRA